MKSWKLTKMVWCCRCGVVWIVTFWTYYPPEKWTRDKYVCSECNRAEYLELFKKRKSL